jgi:actin-related protein
MWNCTARPPHQIAVLAGDEIHRMKNLGQLSYQYPLERGMMVDGSTMMAVWSRVLTVCAVNVGNGGGKRSGAVQQPVMTNRMPSQITVILLEPPLVPSVISEGVDRILFRELGVGRVVKVLGGCMAAVRYLNQVAAGCNDSDVQVDSNSQESREDQWTNDGTKCCCVVDSGYSFTHVIPTQNGAAVVSKFTPLEDDVHCFINILPRSSTQMYLYFFQRKMPYVDLILEAKS